MNWKEFFRRVEQTSYFVVVGSSAIAILVLLGSMQQRSVMIPADKQYQVFVGLVVGAGVLCALVRGIFWHIDGLFVKDKERSAKPASD